MAWLATVSISLQLLDLPGGLVVNHMGWAAADRLVKSHHSVGNRSRDTLIFPRTTHQVVVFVVDDCEYVVAIFVGFNAAPVEVNCLSHHAPVIEAANRHVMERAFSFDIAGDSSVVNDCPRADSAIDFCHSVNWRNPTGEWERTFAIITVPSNELGASNPRPHARESSSPHRYDRWLGTGA